MAKYRCIACKPEDPRDPCILRPFKGGSLGSYLPGHCPLDGEEVLWELDLQEEDD